MSYILDSLKKSEQERRRGSVPDLQSLHHPELGEKAKPRPPWPLIAACTLLLNAGLLAFWILTRPSTPAETISAVAAASGDAAGPGPRTVAPSAPPLAAAPPEPAVVRQAQVETAGPAAASAGQEAAPLEVAEAAGTEISAEDEDLAPASEPAAEIVEGPLRVGQEEQDASVHLPGPEASSPELLTAMPAPAEPSRPAAAPSAGNGSSEVGRLPGTPANVPDLHIAAHFFSKTPASRLVSVNGRILREGQMVTSEVKVEEITASGVIFSYQGRRFFKQIF